MFMNLRIAFRNLLQHRRRTLFLGMALAGVTSLLVLLNGLAAGVQQTMLHTATTLSTGHLNVGGFFKVTAGQSAPVVTEYEKVLAVVRKTMPEMKYAVARGRGWAKVISDQGSMQAGINGVDIKNEPAFKNILKITSGNIDDLSQPNTVLVFEKQLEKLQVKVGDALTISAQTTRGVNNTIDVRVAAIAKDVGLMSQWNVYVPGETLRALYQLRPDATGALHIHLDDARLGDIGTLAARLRKSLEDAGYRMMEPNPQAFWMKFQSVNREEWTGQKLDVTTWEDELSFMTWTLKALQGLSSVLLVILIAILVTGIMNTMWIAIRERTREIGTLRAIGMQRGAVARMFLIESLLLGLGGTVAGALFGALVAAGLNAAHIAVPIGVQLFLMSDHLFLAVGPGLLIGAIVTLTIVTALAALYPSIRAARLRPIEAMAHFG
jgi:ABC-type lipoprotein release transport system permease subunit